MKNGTIVRRAEDAPKVRWYDFKDGVYSIHVATDENGEATIFRSRRDVWPSLTLFKMNLNYSFCRNATEREEQEFLATFNEQATLIEV